MASEPIHWPWQYSPFDFRGAVGGEIVSLDGTSAERFTTRDVAEIVLKEVSGNQFDGSGAFVIRLADGRLAAFALTYGDSYGNDFTDGGVIYVAREIDPLLKRLGRPAMKPRS